MRKHAIDRSSSLASNAAYQTKLDTNSTQPTEAHSRSTKSHQHDLLSFRLKESALAHHRSPARVNYDQHQAAQLSSTMGRKRCGHRQSASLVFFSFIFFFFIILIFTAEQLKPSAHFLFTLTGEGCNVHNCSYICPYPFLYIIYSLLAGNP